MADPIDDVLAATARAPAPARAPALPPAVAPAPGSEAPAVRLATTSRVEAFSDGVMAIAITLLVLDLKVPDATQVVEGGLLAALGARWPSYLAYLAAFLTIGIIWLNHRAFVDRIRRFDGPLHWLNLMLLLGVATLPFPTSLLAAYLAEGGANASAAATIYGLLSVATALPWLLMWRHIVRHPELLEPPLTVGDARAELRRATIGPVVYLVAVPIALVAPLIALVFYIGIALVYAVSNQGSIADGRTSD